MIRDLAKWAVLKARQVNNVLTDTNEPVKWSKSDEETLSNFCTTLNSITQSTAEYNNSTPASKRADREIKNIQEQMNELY